MRSRTCRCATRPATRPVTCRATGYSQLSPGALVQNYYYTSPTMYGYGQGQGLTGLMYTEQPPGLGEGGRYMPYAYEGKVYHPLSWWNMTDPQSWDKTMPLRSEYAFPW